MPSAPICRAKRSFSSVSSLNCPTAILKGMGAFPSCCR
jgi:hypothetical protein